MDQVQESAKKVIKPRLPAAYFAGCDDVEKRRRTLIEALSKPRTPEEASFMDEIEKAYGVRR